MGGPVWFVTGGGRGLGRAFVTAALEAGERVAATVRQPDALADLQAAHGDRLAVEILDVRDRLAAHAAVDRAVDRFGRLDVVVNNAGYGIVGALEELSESEIREHLDTNLLGAIWVSQAALPHLRRQGSGDIVQISTVGAVGSMPTFGLYNAGKWALEGFSEALAAEVAGLGVRVTIAELGGFATDWAWSSLRFAAPLPQYDSLRSKLFGTSEVPWTAEQEAGDDADPSEAAAALRVHLARADRPLRLLVGDDAPEQVAAALAARRQDYRQDPRFSWS